MSPEAAELAAANPAGSAADFASNGAHQTLRLEGGANHRFFFTMPKADAQALLPAPWQASDAATVFRRLGLPVPEAATGQAVAVFDLVDYPGQYKHAVSVVFVEPPRFNVPLVPAPLGMDAVNYADFYVIEYALSLSPARQFLQLAFDADGMPELDSEWSIAPINGPGTGMARAAVEYPGRGQIFDVSYEGLTPNDDAYEFDVTARGWHSNANGTASFGGRQVGEQIVGPILSCTLAAESAQARVAGGTTCRDRPAMAITQWPEGGELWVDYWPGVQPVP